MATVIHTPYECIKLKYIRTFVMDASSFHLHKMNTSIFSPLLEGCLISTLI